MIVSAAGTPAIAILSVSERGRRALAALVLAALVLGTLLTIVDAHAAAWDPGHGHIFHNGVPVPHSHPWDTRADERRLACDAPAPAPHPVVFTPSAEALAGASIASPALAGGFSVPCAPALALQPTPVAAPAAAVDAFAAVPTPPPRG